MSTTTESLPSARPERSPELQADLDAVMHSLRTGVPVDPEVKKRLRALGAAIRQETFEKHGVLDIGVPAIRELRGDLPE